MQPPHTRKCGKVAAAAETQAELLEEDEEGGETWMNSAAWVGRETFLKEIMCNTDRECQET